MLPESERVFESHPSIPEMRPREERANRDFSFDDVAVRVLAIGRIGSQPSWRMTGVEAGESQEAEALEISNLQHVIVSE